MRVGDLLEWLGAACLAAAAYLGVGLALALVVAGVTLVYEAQVYAHKPLPSAPAPPVEGAP